MNWEAAAGPIALSLLNAAIFLFGWRLRAMGRAKLRRLISVAGGAAVAYVFVSLSPELERLGHELAEATTNASGRIEHFAVRLATMAGFILFYGVSVLVIGTRSEEADEEGARARHPLFWVHMLAFGSYAWIAAHLNAASAEGSGAGFALRGLAMALHFLGVASSLREEHGAMYDRVGGPLLAVASIAGCCTGLALELPLPLLAGLMGLIGGGVIANTVISELPREKDGHFGAFAAGALGYAALVLASS
jgi:hypothetical protein